MVQKKTGTFLKRMGVGVLVGIGAVAPGISGGAIAVIFGLYQEITSALAHLFREFRRSLAFLLPLGLGGVVGMILCGSVIEWCFTSFPVMTRCVFIGLMLGTLPSVIHDACRHGFRFWYILVAVFSLFATVFGVKLLPFTLEKAPLSVPLLLLCGIIMGIGTIVPGVSTSFTLMALGLYDRVLNIINRLDVAHLWPILAGFILFILLFSKLVDAAYRKAYGVMSFLVIGLLLGSMVEVFPTALFEFSFVGYWVVLLACCLLSYFTLRLFSAKTENKNE